MSVLGAVVGPITEVRSVPLNRSLHAAHLQHICHAISRGCLVLCGVLGGVMCDPRPQSEVRYTVN